MYKKFTDAEKNSLSETVLPIKRIIREKRSKKMERFFKLRERGTTVAAFSKVNAGVVADGRTGLTSVFCGDLKKSRAAHGLSRCCLRQRCFLHIDVLYM